MTASPTYTAFLNDRRLAQGALADVLRDLGERPEGRRAQVFDDASVRAAAACFFSTTSPSTSTPFVSSAKPVTGACAGTVEQ